MERDYYEHCESHLPDVQGTPRLNVEALSLFAPLSKTVDVAPAASLSDLGGLDFPSIYTGLIGGDARPLNVADEVEQKPEGAKALRPSEVTRREGQFTDESKQGTWNKATEDYRFTKRQSATHECLTDEQIADLERRGLGQKFEITGLTKPGNGSAEDTGMVTVYQPKEKLKNTSFALGMNYEEGRDTRSVYEKMTDFARAAGRRAADPEGWKTYIQGELDKMIGVGEGLNIAKEQTKGAVAAGWKALTDGTVANFLAKPNAINDPLFHAVGGALTAMAEDPNAVNHALERVGTTIMNASERYSALPNREKGHVIGETMFGLANPEGSTEGGELALKIADGVATHVDAAVMKTIQQSLKAAEEAAKSSPEVAQEMKQMLQNYLRGKGLTGPEIEYAGIPKGYFEGLEAPKPDDHVLFMKGDKGLPQGVKPSERVTLSERFGTEGNVIPEIKVPAEVYEAAELQGFDRALVDEKLEKLGSALARAHQRLGEYDPAIHGSQRQYGTALHELLRQNVGADSFLHTEESYLKGHLTNWGKLGSSRPDVVIGDKNNPFATVCLKTLDAVPSAQQERGWVRSLPRLADGTVVARLYLKLENSR